MKFLTLAETCSGMRAWTPRLPSTPGTSWLTNWLKPAVTVPRLGAVSSEFTNDVAATPAAPDNDGNNSGWPGNGGSGYGVQFTAFFCI